MLVAGATFVARGYSGKMDHLSEIIERAIEHNGFSFVEILQPCIERPSFEEDFLSGIEEKKKVNVKNLIKKHV
ncbi:MAG: hypothetical protein KY054_01455 [Candidatus Nealsonbacteria bacterium]|nr:hypothetical protein [Candidatus Nealsonbacteria bacterium]